ncbi:unnamed protein product [Rhodiola kirilowii]
MELVLSPPPKRSFCAWLAVQDKLPTVNKIRGVYGPFGPCGWCKVAAKTNLHLFFECSALQLFRASLSQVGLDVNWSCWDDIISYGRKICIGRTKATRK